MDRRKKYRLADTIQHHQKETKNDISPWVNITRTLLPRIQLTRINAFETVAQEKKQLKEPRELKEYEEPIESKHTTRREEYRSVEKPRLIRYPHKMGHTDINESVSMTLATVDRERERTDEKDNKPDKKQKQLQKAYGRSRFLNKGQTHTLDSSAIKFEEPILSKQYSRFVFEIESQVKSNTVFNQRRHPIQFARKRRIMEILNLNKTGDNPEKQEKPNLKVAFEKFDSFLPSYPVKVLDFKRSSSPISQR